MITDNQYIGVKLTPTGVETINKYFKALRIKFADYKNISKETIDMICPHSFIYPHIYIEQIHEFLLIFGGGYGPEGDKYFEDVKLGITEDEVIKAFDEK